MIKKVLLAAMLAVSIGSIALPATAQGLRKPPPEPRSEVVPEARPGHVWVAGHWEWKKNKHQWVKGKWVKEKRGYHYAQHNWVERDGRWYMERGGWRRGDRDGDGVPDSKDRAPDNPNRR